MVAYELIPKLIRAAYSDDKKTMEDLSILLGRSLKKQYPDISTEIMRIATEHNAGGSIYRSVDLGPVPIDRETRNSLVKVEENYEATDPIFDDRVISQLNDFIKERSLISDFLEEGITPPNSLLLFGKPGVGKTYTAKWLADKLKMPMVTVDLASTISSYLGKSGQNIKSIFDYAKKENVILFLDELDAIAKRRDDEGDLGELKRLVNVLLKELEDCPVTCIVIGATNHPEMLDMAIWRRFDRCIEVPLPGVEERNELFERYLGKWSDLLETGSIECLVSQTEGKSAADISRLCNHIKRQCIINKEQNIDYLAIREMCRNKELTTRDEKIKTCQILKNYRPDLSVREIAEITSIPQSSVARYLRG